LIKSLFSENGTIWGHGAYLGPDYSAEYLHTLAQDVGEALARKRYQRGWEALEPAEREAVKVEIRQLLKKNRFDSRTDTLLFTKPEEDSYHRQRRIRRMPQLVLNRLR
jgi:nitric oxide reductase subunit B